MPAQADCEACEVSTFSNFEGNRVLNVKDLNRYFS